MESVSPRDMVQPVTQSVCNELRAIVASNVVRNTTDGKQPGECIDHVLAGNSLVDSQGQATSRELVYSSTIDSHFNGLSLEVWSKTKSQHHTSFGPAAPRR